VGEDLLQLHEGDLVVERFSAARARLSRRSGLGASAAGVADSSATASACAWATVVIRRAEIRGRASVRTARA
jgi:hypothetical protein